MTRIEVPAFIQPDEDGELIPVEHCTRAQIESEIAWTDSITVRRELEALLRLPGDRLQGDVTVGEV
jgi:hypothetical protein